MSYSRRKLGVRGHRVQGSQVSFVYSDLDSSSSSPDTTHAGFYNLQNGKERARSFLHEIGPKAGTFWSRLLERSFKY